MKVTIWVGVCLVAMVCPEPAHAQVTGPTTTTHGTISQPPPKAEFGFHWDSRNMNPPVVSLVDPNSPAQRAGLAAGDIILMVDDRDMHPAQGLFPDAVPGRRYLMHIQRGTERLRLVIEAAPPKPQLPKPASGAPKGGE